MCEKEKLSNFWGRGSKKIGQSGKEAYPCFCKYMNYSYFVHFCHNKEEAKISFLWTAENWTAVCDSAQRCCLYELSVMTLEPALHLLQPLWWCDPPACRGSSEQKHCCHRLQSVEFNSLSVNGLDCCQRPACINVSLIFLHLGMQVCTEIALKFEFNAQVKTFAQMS